MPLTQLVMAVRETPYSLAKALGPLILHPQTKRARIARTFSTVSPGFASDIPGGSDHPWQLRDWPHTRRLIDPWLSPVAIVAALPDEIMQHPIWPKQGEFLTTIITSQPPALHRIADIVAMLTHLKMRRINATLIIALMPDYQPLNAGKLEPMCLTVRNAMCPIVRPSIYPRPYPYLSKAP
jgi:hypothetical protein